MHARAQCPVYLANFDVKQTHKYAHALHLRHIVLKGTQAQYPPGAPPAGVSSLLETSFLIVDDLGASLVHELYGVEDNNHLHLLLFCVPVMSLLSPTLSLHVFRVTN